MTPYGLSYIFTIKSVYSFQALPNNILKHFGVTEVPTKSSVSPLSPLYLREDLIKIDRLKIYAQLNAILGSIKTKKSNLKQDFPIGNNAIRAKDVSLQLGVQIRLISKLEHYGLLKRVIYKTNSDINSRYYSFESYMATKRWLDSAKTVNEFSDQCQIHRAHFTKRYISNQFITPLHLNAITSLISKEDQLKIITHRKKFCTCSEADLYHKAPEKHFQNLVRTGRIPFIEKSQLSHDFGTILLKWSVVKKYK